LDLLLGLLADRHHAVQVLVDEEPHEHLQNGSVKKKRTVLINSIKKKQFIFF
jgi:hypothetical protein